MLRGTGIYCGEEEQVGEDEGGKDLSGKRQCHVTSGCPLMGGS